MTILSANGVLRASAVIAKTTETSMGEIACDGYDNLALFLNYTKGDETGLNIYPYCLRVSGGNEFPLPVWTPSSGVYTAVVTKIQLLATAKRVYVFDVRGIPVMKFYQGGSNNDGTPTGTLAVEYSLTK